MNETVKRPEIKIIKNVKFPQIEQIKLNGDVPLTYLTNFQEPIIQLVLNIKAGSWHQPKPLVAYSTVKMLTEGTRHKTSKQIAEIIDYYGIFIKKRKSEHFSYILVKVLTKNLEPALQILQEILTEPVFPEEELKIFLNNEKQEYLIDQEEVETVARQLYQAAIYGFEHPYGRYALPEDFDNVTRQDVKNFFEKYYNKQNLSIFAGGYLTDRELNLINKYLTDIRDGQPSEDRDIPFSPKKEKYIYKPKESSLQSAVFIGNRTINHTHPDYFALDFTVELLGGYFGSRLMTNIREQKGLSYGIFADINLLPKAGELTIESAVRKEDKDLVIKEIEKEINLLKQKGATQDEIFTVKNYIISNILKLASTTLVFTELLSYLERIGTDINFLKTLIEQTQQMTNKKVKEMAEKYLNFDDFYKVIVG